MPYFDTFSAIPGGWLVAGIVLLVLVLGYLAAPLWIWTAATAVVLYGTGAPLWLWIIFAVAAVLFNVVPVRRAVISGPLMKTLNASGFMPTISETEQAAIESGNVWIDGDLFSGRPDFGKLMDEAYPSLSEEERAFLDGPVEEVCRMTDDWDVFQRGDLSDEVWDFLKRERFFWDDHSQRVWRTWFFVAGQ